MSRSAKRQRSLSDNEQPITSPKRPECGELLQGGFAIHHRCSPLSHEDYDIAWICALPLELAASRAMLDEEHETLAANDNDPNAYVLGRIAHHNVVMVALPGVYGKVNAAAVAAHLKRSFPNVRATLMVGIGGGAPGEADLYLRDVVVGTRVMEYDLGKATHDGQFEPTAHPKMPSPLLSSAVSNLRSKHGMDPSSLRSQRLMETKAVRYRRPEQADRLFQASYPHPDNATTCDDCDETKLQPRRARPNDDFWIHYGVVASGDSVNKDPRKRDEVSRELKALCFEMEAAGIMDNLQCLPIRGICDYSDSHKNKVWQHYAAATAAAYARELLETISPKTKNDVQSSYRGHANIGSSASSSAELAERREAFLEMLDFPQMNTRKDAIRAEQAKTCRWFLTHPQYRRWIDSSTHDACCSGLLWIRGKAGAGKSTLMKFLFSEVRKKNLATAVVSFFFHAQGEYLEKSIVGMYRSLLKQILTRIPDLQPVLDHAEISSTSEQSSPSLNVVKDLFRDTIMALHHHSLICFIDALDESDENDVREMVQFFEGLTELARDEKIRFRVCFSSRPYPYIQVNDDHLLTLEDADGHREDLKTYVGKCLKAPKKDQAALQGKILEKASGVFLWVVLVVRILNKETSDGTSALGRVLSRKLEQIPPNLSQLFREMITRDQKSPKQLQRCILWVLCAFRPLTSAEFCHAMWAAGLEDEDVNDEPPDVGDDEIMALVTSSSKGLVEISNAKKKDSRVQFIHESVRDFLIKERGIQELWPDLGFNWEGPSHELLRPCCESYLMSPAVRAVITTSQGRNVTAEKTTTDVVMKGDEFEATASDNLSTTADHLVDLDNTSAESTPPKEYSFLVYASQHILEHADKAESSVPQQDFLSRFFRNLGTGTLNCGQTYKIRRYGPTATPTYIMADKGLASLLRLTLAADPSMTDDRTLRFRHPFFAAIANGHKDVVALLLGLPSIIYEGENLMEGVGRVSDARGFANRSPMTWACQEGRVNLVRALVLQGASLTEKDPAGYTPLRRAVERKDAAIIQFLIAKGVNTKDVDYAKAIGRAFANKDFSTARILLKDFGGWDKTPLNRVAEQSTWLSLAAESGIGDLVQLLIRNGAKVNQEMSILASAAEKGHLKVVKILADADVNLEGHWLYYGFTALICASNNGHGAVVQLLLDRGADLHAKDNGGRTALMFASTWGYKAVVQLLLNHGADCQ